MEHQGCAGLICVTSPNVWVFFPPSKLLPGCNAPELVIASLSQGTLDFLEFLIYWVGMLAFPLPKENQIKEIFPQFLSKTSVRGSVQCKHLGQSPFSLFYLNKMYHHLTVF